jgi:hypothetical protein
VAGDCVVFIKKLISGDFSLFLSFGGCKRKKKTLISNIDFFRHRYGLPFSPDGVTRFQTLLKPKDLMPFLLNTGMSYFSYCFLRKQTLLCSIVHYFR